MVIIRQFCKFYKIKQVRNYVVLKGTGIFSVEKEVVDVKTDNS